MRNEKLYREAIQIASYAEERFLKANEVYRSYGGEGDLKETHRTLVLQPAAAEACAQQSLIAELFGVSEEKVHQDLASAILAR